MTPPLVPDEARSKDSRPVILKILEASCGFVLNLVPALNDAMLELSELLTNDKEPLVPVTRPKSRVRSFATLRTAGQSAPSAMICTADPPEARTRELLEALNDMVAF